MSEGSIVIVVIFGCRVSVLGWRVGAVVITVCIDFLGFRRGVLEVGR